MLRTRAMPKGCVVLQVLSCRTELFAAESKAREGRIQRLFLPTRKGLLVCCYYSTHPLRSPSIICVYRTTGRQETDFQTKRVKVLHGLRDVFARASPRLV